MVALYTPAFQIAGTTATNVRIGQVERPMQGKIKIHSRQASGNQESWKMVRPEHQGTYADKGAHPELFQSDGLHPTREAQPLLMQLMLNDLQIQ